MYPVHPIYYIYPVSTVHDVYPVYPVYYVYQIHPVLLCIVSSESSVSCVLCVFSVSCVSHITVYCIQCIMCIQGVNNLIQSMYVNICPMHVFACIYRTHIKNVSCTQGPSQSTYIVTESHATLITRSNTFVHDSIQIPYLFSIQLIISFRPYRTHVFAVFIIERNILRLYILLLFH